MIKQLASSLLISVVSGQMLLAQDIATGYETALELATAAKEKQAGLAIEPEDFGHFAVEIMPAAEKHRTTMLQLQVHGQNIGKIALLVENGEVVSRRVWIPIVGMDIELNGSEEQRVGIGRFTLSIEYGNVFAFRDKETNSDISVKDDGLIAYWERDRDDGHGDVWIRIYKTLENVTMREEIYYKNIRTQKMQYRITITDPASSIPFVCSEPGPLDCGRIGKAFQFENQRGSFRSLKDLNPSGFARR